MKRNQFVLIREIRGLFFILSFFFFLSSFIINAQDLITEAETIHVFTDKTADTAEISHTLWIQATSNIEGKFGYTFNCKLPFMQGESALTNGNNINFELTAEASPVSLIGVTAVTLTPAAFLEFSAGCRIGTGWTIDLFGSKIHGLAVTRADANNDRIFTNAGGLFTKLHASGTFQFDLAAIFPGDWNHIVFRTIHEINYSGNSKATGTESWIFESTSKDYINGFIYYSNYVIGYQMPIVISMIAFMAEAERTLYNIPGQEKWYEDLTLWTLSPAVFLDIHKKIDIMIAVQFRSQINYESDWEDKYYRTLTVNQSNPTRIEFYRVAAIATYSF